MMVNTHMANTNTASSDPYMYQVRVKKAACVQQDDSTEQALKKIRDFWTAQSNLPTCNNVQFDVLDGNVLKFAASSKFDEFLDDMITWGADLNTVDPSDNRTVLDYVQYHIKKNEGNDLQKRFLRYFAKLRAAGAKFASELN